MAQRIFLTGATGGMGVMGMRAILAEPAANELVILARPSDHSRTMLAEFEGAGGLTVVWGDLGNYEDVLTCVRGADIVLHVGALVSPEADYHPQLAMEVNYGSTMNILTAIAECGQQDSTAMVYIGTVAETGDRMPPIHWGRVGDPLKPSVYDYYAVSKVAAERAVIESGLTRWVSLRQTGILSKKMSEIDDPIMFHNPLDNFLEYVSDRDSGMLLRNVCRPLPDEFWNHVYNIGGGASCRTSTWQMYQTLYGALGIRNLGVCMDSKWYATRNFHGHYYLDSDRLEQYLHFQRDSMQYYYDAYLAGLGSLPRVTRVLCRLPGGERFLGGILRRRFLKTARRDHGTVQFIERGMDPEIDAYWGSRAAWETIPPVDQLEHFDAWDTVVPIDHGYDESKPETNLSLDDVRGAATFRGGECLAATMEQGDWRTPLPFRCAFDHHFAASPRLFLEGGHWCDVCERTSWNYHHRAERDPFFAQIWRPLHPADEPARTYAKEVDELSVTFGRTPPLDARTVVGRASQH